MSAITIGNCSPCCGGNESQSVTSSVPYMSLGASSLDYFNPDYTPVFNLEYCLSPVRYLTSETRYKNASGEYFYQWFKSDANGNYTYGQTGSPDDGPPLGLERSKIFSYDAFGNLVKTVSQYDAATVTKEALNGYTYQAAAAAAVKLLDQVILLGLGVYPVSFPGGAANPFGRKTVPTRFCYPSEFAKYYPASTINNLFVAQQQSGVPLIYYEPTISTIPFGDADNGNSFIYSPGVNPVLEGNIWAKKSARRTNTVFTTKQEFLLAPVPGTARRVAAVIFGYNGSPPLITYTVQPLPGLLVYPSGQFTTTTLVPPLGPGELLFLPSDIQGTGMARWQLRGP